MERVTKLSTEKAVVIFTASTCPMCHTVMSLFSDLGVCAAATWSATLPAAGPRGKLVGSSDKIMSLHLSGKLVPLLKGAGAI